MLISGTLRRLLIAGTCLCVCGAPFQPTQVGSCEGGRCAGSDVKSADGEHVMLDVGAGGGGAGPHGRPEGIGPVTQAGNGGSLDGRSGPSEAGGEAWSQRSEEKSIDSTPEMGERQAEDLPGSTGGRKPDMDAPGRPSGLTTPQLEKDQQSSHGGFSDSLQDPEANLASSPEPPNPSASFWTHTSLSPIPPLVFVTPRTATPLAIWGRDGATMSSIPDPFLPEIGPREDGPESLWTEAARPGGADTPIPLSQDEATEATMSSEALPLIFEPFEDVTPEGGAAAVTMVPGNAQLPGAMATGGLPLSDLDQLVTVETDGDGPSHAPPVLIPDWTSPWQTSGAEILEPISSSGPSVSQRQVGTEPEDQSEKVAARTPNLEENLSSTGPSLSSFQHAMTTVTMATHHPVHKSRSGLEEMESEEEQDEDEEDENSEESVEEESEEDLTETPKTSSTQPPYSLIPPPPVWVQRNQGLMRSWVELIREKAGYVSGMLAPVGIGITGALLIVGALYSIRMIHRKRRNSFKHQRRKVRQPEQPREPGTSRQDQAMLLADSSEDEF
ncbi:uncharacterized protein LOC110951400 isoform X1 [Acanthochromis polyacanthus]|uniref:uncharacterized protein LOC110951400 isoform X1 n=1 Tax=Acanthochromis polyacanthus TaxID=80966 RepID=UPI002234668B|nr:uncharacterized protein LOC110951400 isoform X1 [Acanthochromis polyacanthus]XP_051816485.1 uncharacterized protein LOC110951400 isoform X1 [Acanthochromis polyacanthus]XP_051816486.1 uncharacterized protein LOC110951400 isoform X1 [Acanthochromis polyacanthus]